MTIVTFAPAARLGSHIIITAYGVSGCGKTLSLLLLGRGLAGPNGKLGMIDTETGRGRIYAGRVPGGYLYGELTAPFTPERYIEAIDDAEKAGVEVLVLDSGSHEWEGFGGILEIADAGESRGGQPLEGLVKWAKPKARHKKYVNRLLNSHMHLLIGLRAKEKMKQYTAKDAPLPSGVRVGDIISEGFTPIQDKRFIFETTVQLFLPLGPRADLGKPIVEKCPEDLWAAFPEGQQISEKTGELIREWVAWGEPVDKELLTLRRQAEEAAGGGVDAMKAYWHKLGRAKQAQLVDRLDNLRSIAESADAEKGAPPSQSADGQTIPQPQMGSDDSGEDVRTGAPAYPSAAEPASESTLNWGLGSIHHLGTIDSAAPSATARTCAEHGVIDCARCREAPFAEIAPPRLNGQPDWRGWHARFWREMQRCESRADLATLIGENHEHIETYNVAFPRLAPAFAATRTKCMEELPDG